MTQFYFDPERESDPHALPDGEVFYADDLVDDEGELPGPGWFWRACFPGCLPDGPPIGPFDSEEEALEEARESVRDF